MQDFISLCVHIGDMLPKMIFIALIFTEFTVFGISQK